MHAEFSNVTYTDVETMTPRERMMACEALSKRVKDYNDGKKKEASAQRASAARSRAGGRGIRRR